MPDNLTTPQGALQQLDELLAGITQAAYQHCCDLLPGGTVGAHVRHCLEFYQCLFAGIESGAVDYDARERNAEIESDQAAALREVGRIRTCEWPRIESLPRDTPLRVRESLDAWQASSLGRELGFAASHTVHHLALIAVLLRDHGGCFVGPGIGFAPSTSHHLVRQSGG
jgi:uncharacterized damage-inducible protein DinB